MKTFDSKISWKKHFRVLSEHHIEHLWRIISRLKFKNCKVQMFLFAAFLPLFACFLAECKILNWWVCVPDLVALLQSPNLVLKVSAVVAPESSYLIVSVSGVRLGSRQSEKKIRYERDMMDSATDNVSLIINFRRTYRNLTEPRRNSTRRPLPNRQSAE